VESFTNRQSAAALWWESKRERLGRVNRTPASMISLSSIPNCGGKKKIVIFVYNIVLPPQVFDLAEFFARHIKI